MPLPSTLVPQTAPSWRNILDRIDDWVIHHLIRTAQSDPHYENYLYGPTNALLGEIFPISRRYMVIPQALLRRPMREEEIPVDLANISFGSTGAVHESRNLPGAEHLKQFPDFVIVKVTPQLGITRNHYIVGLVEVKRAPSFGESEERQMGNYMLHAARMPNKVLPLYGYLVMGNEVKTFVARKRPETGKIVVKEVRGTIQLTGRDNGFFENLCRVSATNWNYQAS